MADRVTRLAIFCACLGCLALLAATVRVHLPWFVAEHRRLEPWKVPVIWTSEAIGLVSFLAYTVSLALPERLRRWRSRKLPVRLVLFGACLDAAFSLWALAGEYVAHGRAVQAPAQVVEGKARVDGGGATRFTLTCTFQDRNGAAHTAWFPLATEAEVPVNVGQAILGGQLPVPTDVVYDPRWPGRTWLAGVEYSDDGRVHFYSLMALFCSTLLAFPLAGWGDEYRHVPPPGTAPFFMMIVFLGLAGLVQGW